MKIIELDDRDLGAVAGGFVVGEILNAIKGGALRPQRSNTSSGRYNWNDFSRRGGDVGTVAEIDLGTTGGGNVSLGTKKDVWPGPFRP
jgi:hypothetical protein